MKGISLFLIIVIFICSVYSCKENPKNTFGGPSNNPKDTASSRRDTSSAGTRTN
jgi:hypothetical protein